MNCWEDLSILFYKYCFCCLVDDPKYPNNKSPNNAGNNYEYNNDEHIYFSFMVGQEKTKPIEITKLMPHRDMVYHY